MRTILIKGYHKGGIILLQCICTIYTISYDTVDLLLVFSIFEESDIYLYVCVTCPCNLAYSYEGMTVEKVSGSLHYIVINPLSFGYESLLPYPEGEDGLLYKVVVLLYFTGVLLVNNL